MPLKQHGRQYDIILLGASGSLPLSPRNAKSSELIHSTGYTGLYTAEHITKHLPTDLKWAIAGRTHSKLQHVIDECQKLNPDRVAPSKLFSHRMDCCDHPSTPDVLPTYNLTRSLCPNLANYTGLVFSIC